MATFPYTPDWGAAPELQPRVLQAKFGDGYDQRTADGLNDLLSTWKLSFSVRTQAEATAIAAWFARHRAHVTAFDWAGVWGDAVDEQFGTGDGTTPAFQLTRNGFNVASASGVSIYRTDWQGKQLMYVSPRTNWLTYSQAVASGWTFSGSTVSSDVISAPDGTPTADLVKEDTSNATHGFWGNLSPTPGLTYTISFFIKPSGRTKFKISSGGIIVEFDLTSLTSSDLTGTSLSRFITSLADGWYRIGFSFTATASSSSNLYFNNGTTYTYVGDGASGVYVWGVQSEVGSSSTSYIPTTSAAVTVTDYTLSASGLVTFATAPVSGASLTWSGSCTFKYLAVKWTPPKPDDYNSWSVTAEFRQVPA